MRVEAASRTARRAARLAALSAACVLVLAGCESTRFGGRGPALASRQVPAELPQEPAVSSVPSGSVTAEPLPPLAGAGQPSVMPGSPAPVETLGSAPPVQAAGPASRSAAIGAWMAREASGTCKVNLASTPSLDLYRASAGACANKDLARVTAWDFRDGEVYLYQPGGAVAARLRASGSGLSGVLAKSGAPLTLTRS